MYIQELSDNEVSIWGLELSVVSKKYRIVFRPSFRIFNARIFYVQSGSSISKLLLNMC